MFVLPAAIGTFLLVNLLCGFVALGVGFAAGVWFFGTRMAVKAPTKNPPAKKNGKSKQTAERAAMAARRVADLTKNVASDVGDHTAKMKAISAELTGIDREAAGANGAVFSALDQILAANAELQQRLEKAEKRLADQAAEIRVHESEARTDSLTGLSNRRAFDHELNRRFSEWERNQMPCTLVLLDIDFFKKFNDTHGHQVGDEVLRQVAKVLKAQSREMDLPCRYGGEEFAAILPTTDAPNACTVAERIRAAVEASVTIAEGKTLKVTCSVGVAQFSNGCDVAQLIRRADEALYASKEAGRNCGHLHDGSRSVPITAVAIGSKVEPKKAPDGSEPSPVDPSSPKSKNGARDGRVTAPGSFLHKLKRRVTESHRFGIPLCVMHLQVDDYDVVARKYGPAIARQILDAAEPAMQKTLREMDVLARLEKGEFVVMLPGRTQSESNQAATLMRKATICCVLPLLDRDFQLRFREGVAELQPNETAQELLARARQTALEADAVGQTADE